MDNNTQTEINEVDTFDNMELVDREKLLAGEPNTQAVEQGMMVIDDKDIPF